MCDIWSAPSWVIVERISWWAIPRLRAVLGCTPLSVMITSLFVGLEKILLTETLLSWLFPAVCGWGWRLLCQRAEWTPWLHRATPSASEAGFAHVRGRPCWCLGEGCPENFLFQMSEKQKWKSWKEILLWIRLGNQTQGLFYVTPSFYGSEFEWLTRGQWKQREASNKSCVRWR